MFAASCNSSNAAVPLPKLFKPCLKISTSLALDEKVAIQLPTVATAAPTVNNGPREAANEAPSPLAADEAAVRDVVAPFALVDNCFVAAEVLFKDDIAFLASTLKVTILSAT